MPDDPQVDLTKIDFPSDAITIKDIRRLHPEQVDTDGELTLFNGDYRPTDLFSGADGTIGLLLFTERDFAQTIFEQTLDTKQSSGMTRQEGADELIKFYKQFGLATGDHHAKELVRGIESQVTAQARLHTGRQP